MSDIAQELLDTVTPYWEAEAEVSKRFFEGSPTHEGHIYWLRAQIWKELHPVDGYFNGIHQELVKMADMNRDKPALNRRHRKPAADVRDVVDDLIDRRRNASACLKVEANIVGVLAPGRWRSGGFEVFNLRK